MFELKIYTNENKRIDFGYSLEIKSRQDWELLRAAMNGLVNIMWPKPKPEVNQ